MENPITLIRKASVYAHRIDYLLSADDGEESFHKRLKEDMKNIKMYEGKGKLMANLEKSLLDLEKRELAKHCQKYKDKEFLDWLADRLENVYKESPNTDFVIRLREIANNYLENN